MALRNRTRSVTTPNLSEERWNSLSPQTPSPARYSGYPEPLSINTIFERLVSPPRDVYSRLRQTYHQPRPAMQSQTFNAPFCIDSHLHQPMPDMQSEAYNDFICIRYPFLQPIQVVRPRPNFDPHWLQQNAIPHRRLRMFVDTDRVHRVYFYENPLLSSTASVYAQQSVYPHLGQTLAQYETRRRRGRNHQHHRHHQTSEQLQHHRSHSRDVRYHPYEEVIIHNQWEDQQDASTMHSGFHRHCRNHHYRHRYGDHHQSGQSQSDNWQGPLDLSVHADLNRWRDQQNASAMHPDFHRHQRNHSYRQRYGDHHQSGQSQPVNWQGPLDLSAHTELDISVTKYHPWRLASTAKYSLWRHVPAAKYLQ
ncbi:hypothetical protein PoB_000644200 [Plakobranchus ocellatus]|uniref:Uncharacterized protein n=1 Tax=Plakobranchus ocellatus TaxID=259542 RepID=A0AAV3YAU0_9GAST|nr:hypothetical protein PoB_000644200 [Plakobranchus ocellatus]